MELILYGREGGTLVGGVTNFKCLGRPLYQTEIDWPSLQQNYKRLWRVWRRLGDIIIREGAESKVAKFSTVWWYRRCSYLDLRLGSC